MTSAAVEEIDLGRRRFFRTLVAADRDRPSDNPWRLVEGLSAGSGDVFWSGLALEDEVFIVGDEGAVFQYRQGEWSRMVVPVAVPIHAIWGTSRNRLVAVGWMGAILDFDGQAWSLKRGCVVDGSGKYASDVENAPLFDVAGDETGNLWAVGDNGTILAYRDEGWIGEESGTTAHLRTVVALPDGGVLAAGADGAVLQRGEDGTWRSLDSPVRTNFQSATLLPSGEVLLAGGRYFIDANGFRGDLLRLRDGTFERLAPEAPVSRFRSLAPYRNGALAVGDRGQIHFIDNDRVERLQSATGHDLLGIVSLETGEALAVGDFGTVLTAAPDVHEAVAPAALVSGAQAPNWVAMDSGTDRQLWGLWSDPHDGTLYACGEEGTVLRFAGDGWNALPPVGSLGLHCLCDGPDGGLLAAGQLGEVHLFDGSRWHKQFDLHVDITILSLWSDTDGHRFAAGDEGLLLRWDGQTWQRENSGTKSALYSLWGPDRDHLLAVGDFGLVLRWNGTRWDEFHAGTENFLFDVWGDALDNIFIVGLSGSIGHFNGNRWSITPARAREDLLAVSGNASGVYAVGAAGTALRYCDHAWSQDRTGSDAGLRAVCAGSPHGVFAAGDGGTILRRTD